MPWRRDRWPWAATSSSSAAPRRRRISPPPARFPKAPSRSARWSPSWCGSSGTLELLLDEPDYTTATRVAAAINTELTPGAATAVDSGRVRVALGSQDKVAAVSMMARIESIAINPDIAARVVVNERTGTVVSGGDVYLSAVTVSHGDLRVSIVERFAFSQPEDVAVFGRSSGVRSFARPRPRCTSRKTRPRP